MDTQRLICLMVPIVRKIIHQELGKEKISPTRGFIVVCLRDLWMEWVGSNCTLFTELPVPPQAAEVVGTLNCVFKISFWYSIHSILHLDLKDDIFFLQCFFFV